MAGRLETFEQFLTTNLGQINILHFMLYLVLAAILSYILAKLYIKYGKAISNRRKFAGNFVLLTTTTTLIITIVKSSLALSLGLVGALSIVRFRAAIKEPEELAFLFLCIAIGLGLGAAQVKVTLIAFFIISLLILGRHFRYKKEENQNLYLTIAGKNIKLKEIVKVLNRNCSSVHLRRFDKIKGDSTEAVFSVDFDSFNELEKVKQELESISKSISITYLDKSGI